MGRRSELDKTKFVSYDAATNISTCRVCQKPLKGCLMGNIKRHYAKIHNQKFCDEEGKADGATAEVQENLDDDTDYSSEKSSPLGRRFSAASTVVIGSNIEHSCEQPPPMKRINVASTVPTASKISSSSGNSVESVPIQRRDEAAIYADYLAMKLRAYSTRTQNIAQHKINNLLFEADMGTFDSIPTVDLITGLAKGN